MAKPNKLMGGMELLNKAAGKLQKIKKSYTTAVQKARSTPAYKKKVEKARYEGRI